MSDKTAIRVPPTWAGDLARVAAGGLSLRPGFAAIAARWDAWWRFAADRPLLIASARLQPGIRWDKAFDLVDRPAEWLAVRRAQVEHTYWAGDAIPFVRADIGPVAMAAFLGAPLHLAQAEQTSWQDPIIESWDAPGFARLDPAGRELTRVLRLLAAIAADAAGRYAVCLPDLTGAIDALANMRGPESLCIDLFENRDRVLAASLALVDSWEAVFGLMHETVLERGACVVQWLGCWSPLPYTIPTCDFNALIGPRDFVEVCLPSLEDQARRAGRCVFHLDGPQAARHAPALAAAPAITAIQYTPGAGTPSAVGQLPLLRGIQRAGKPLYVYCPPAEVERLCGELDPGGLVLNAGEVESTATADRLARVAERSGA
jgi:hypothetical protein